MESPVTPFKVRILLRQGEEYLQPSGHWGQRETAKDFPSSVFAYYWAKEQALLGTEVLLAFADPYYDFVAMRV